MIPTKYIAILGRQPELGLVELESLLGSENVEPFGREAVLLKQELDLNRLGGAQKLARVIYEGPARDLNEAPLPLIDLPIGGGKTTFGLSMYGLQATQRFVVATGLTLKKRLKAKGSVRFVAPQTGTSLTAAQVKFNGLLRSGFELVVAVSKQSMVVGITEQIQDIDAYAARDYARPTRSAKVGMLPPKLAQIMINTTSAPLVYDPFCGTGVVLQEALLLGRAASGSDNTQEMVEATRNNLEWLKHKRPDLPDWTINLADAKTVELPKDPLSVVSEGYLGPNQSRTLDPKTLTTLKREALDLYAACLKNWSAQLDLGDEVTITAPVWRTKDGWKNTSIIDRLSDLGYTLKSFAHSDARKLVYRRPNQFVGRQLLILRKK